MSCTEPLFCEASDGDSASASFIDEFLSTKSRRTAESYKNALRAYAALSNFDSVVVAVDRLISLGQVYSSARLDEYRELMNKRCVAPATINLRLSALSSCLKFAKDSGMIEWSINANLVPTSRRRKRREISPDVISEMLKYAARPRDVALIVLIADARLGRAEVHGLNVRDVDIDGGRINVVMSRSSSCAWMDLSSRAVSAMRNWLAVHPSAVDPYAPLFVSFDRAHYGVRLSCTSIYKIISNIGKMSGYQVRPSDVRKSSFTTTVRAMPAGRSDHGVYFIQAGDGGYIKIGYARDAESRMCELQVGCPQKLKLLAVESSGYITESILHNRFSAHRFRGEWFYPHAEILDYVSNLNLYQRAAQ